MSCEEDGHPFPSPPTHGEPITMTCHCKAITLTVPELPKEINECQCCKYYSLLSLKSMHGSLFSDLLLGTAICYRLSTGWAYYSPDKITIDIEAKNLTNKAEQDHPIRYYTWNKRYVEFGTCANCGCTVYWRHTKSGEDAAKARGNALKSGINMKLLGPELYNPIRKRYGRD